MALDFRLQPALDRALSNETLARRVLVDARLACDDVHALLATVESRLAELRAAMPVTAAKTLAGAFAASEAAAIALAALQRRRSAQAQRARALLERARESYARAAAQRGALERLRERRLDEFARSLEAAEAAEADEANGRCANALAHEAAQTSLRNFPA